MCTVSLLVTHRIKLAVVSEPDDDDGECEDVGKAYVSVRDILQTERDLIEQDVDSKAATCMHPLAIRSHYISSKTCTYSIFQVQVALTFCFLQAHHR